jgi:glutamine synthetase
MADLSSEELAERAARVRAIVDDWRARGVRFVRFEFADVHGMSRSKLVPIEAVEGYAERGLNIYGGTIVLDTRSDVVPGTLYNEEIGYGDHLLWPDPDTALELPWAPGTARFLCDLGWQGGGPIEAAPRRVLARVLEQLRARGILLSVGVEYEFYLLDGATHEPLFTGWHIFNTQRNTFHPVIGEILESMEEAGLELITANCEYAGSQWEINYRPAVGMRAADRAFTFKAGVKEIAQRHGLVATFMSKPFSQQAGSGAHTHVSLLGAENAEPLLWDADAPWHLSEVGRHFLGGMLRWASAVDAFLAPTVNCLRRRRRHTFSPTNVSWGIEDRSALVRLKGNSPASLHFENRAPSAMSNPYLAIAAIAASGLLGIEEGVEPTEPAAKPAEDHEGLEPLPRTLEESLRALAAAEPLRKLLGDELVTAYLQLRRYELGRFADHVSDWERAEYLELY